MIVRYKFFLIVFLVVNHNFLWSTNIKISQLLKEKKSPAFAQKPKEFKIRVLLDEKKDFGQWTIQTKAGVVVSDVLNPRKKNSSKQPSTVVCFKNNSLYINGKKLQEKSVKIDATKGMLGFNTNIYQGSLLCVIQDKSCYLINQLEIEDYVYSVLRSESWPGWPLEVNKVFAIAARTYVLAKVLECNNKFPYHIKNTNIHQTYNGFHESDTLKKAVNETKGLIVTHNKKPILAMFDSCCGGVVPAHLSGVDFKKSPYLARTNVCDYCKPCKIYEWKWELPCADLETLLQKKGFPVYAISAIRATHDKAGAVQEIIIQSSVGPTTLSGKQFYSLSPKIKSFCYSVKKVARKIILEGKGLGHHLGLCQWGARKMIDHGFGHLQILKKYYPGTRCMKLTLR